MDKYQVLEQIAWAARVLGAPETTTLERLLATALVETSRALINESKMFDMDEWARREVIPPLLAAIQTPRANTF